MKIYYTLFTLNQYTPLNRLCLMWNWRKQPLSIHQIQKQPYRSRHQRFSIKKVLLRILHNSQESTCASVCILINLQAWGLELYLKRESGTGVFLWYFSKFLRTSFSEKVVASANIFFKEKINAQYVTYRGVARSTAST